MHYIWQFYLLLGVILVQGLFLGFGSKFGKQIFLWLCFAELVFIAGFRAWNIGADTQIYIQAFITAINHIDLSSSYMEKGYIWYNQFIALFTSNPQTILVVNAFVITGSLLWLIKKYSSVVLLPVLLLVISYFAGTMNIMRQYLALTIVLYGFQFVIKRQLIPFLLCCLFASTFHYSSLLAVGLYFLYPLPFKTKYAIVIGVFSVCALWLLAPIVDQIISLTERYERYKGNILLGDETAIASIIKTFIQLVIFGFCYFSYRYIYRPNGLVSSINLEFLVWCSFVATCLQFVSIRGTVLERLVLYYSIFDLISIPFFVRCYPVKLRISIAVILVGCFILCQSVIFVYRPEWNPVLPFKFCF